MIKLSKLTDYAVVLLSQIARRQGGLSTASILVEETGLPYPTVSKVLKMLSRGGLLVTQRGPTGGYQLAKETNAISMADIITAMDGPIHVADCVEGHAASCQMEDSCPMNGHWNRVNKAVRSALQGVTLAEMVAEMVAEKVNDKPRIKQPHLIEQNAQNDVAA